MKLILHFCCCWWWSRWPSKHRFYTNTWCG